MLVGVRVGPSSPAALLVFGRRRRIPDWPYDLAAPRGSSGVDQGDLEPPGYEFTAFWTVVRDGVLLHVPWWKVPVNMQPKFQQSLPIDRQ